jgi:Na+/citrate or Na+/malate symporter
MSWLLPITMAGLAFVLAIVATGLLGTTLGRDYNSLIVVIVVLAVAGGTFIGVLLSRAYYSNPRH